MIVMKKIWVYKRTGIKGWWVGWYESGKRKAKALPTRKLAEHYCQLKYSQLNSDVFTGIVTIAWKQMIEEYTVPGQDQAQHGRQTTCLSDRPVRHDPGLHPGRRS